MSALGGDAPAEACAAAEARVETLRTGHQEAYRALRELHDGIPGSALRDGPDPRPSDYAYTGMAPRARAEHREGMAGSRGNFGRVLVEADGG